MSNRMERVNSMIKRGLAEIFEQKLSDPRLEGEFITITDVNTSKDLKYSQIHLSIFGKKDKNEILNVVKTASGFIKKLLASQIDLRTMPDLDFRIDNSMEYSEKIENLIEEINKNHNNK